MIGLGPLINATLASLQTRRTQVPPQTSDDNANYRYLKPSATGSGNGLDWNNAAAFSSVTFTRGLTYWLADGSYTSRTLSTANSSTSRITIRKATPTWHGTNTGWSDSLGDGQAAFTGQMTVTTDYWTIDGQVRNSDWWKGEIDEYGIKITSDGSRVLRLDNGSGAGADNCIFQYIDMVGQGRDVGTQDGIYSLVSNANITLQYSTVRDNGRCHWISAGGASGRLVQGCFFTRNTSKPAAHGEPFACWGSDTNSVYRWNVIEDPEGTAVWAYINNGLASGGQKYGNVIYHSANYLATTGSRPTHNYGIAASIWVSDDNSQANAMTGLRYFNNTHHNLVGTYSGVVIQLQQPGQAFVGPQGGVDNIVRNNIWDDCDPTNHVVTGACTHNWYRSTTASGDGGNSQTGSSNPFVDSANKDFHLTGGTNAGTMSGSPAGNSVDRDGVARTTPHRGAFEFQ